MFESPLWPAVENEHGICPEDAPHQESKHAGTCTHMPYFIAEDYGDIKRLLGAD